jgi:NADH dehydrogenase
MHEELSTPDRAYAVTGAYGYSGKYIAHRLLGRGRRVITLTNSANRANPFAGAVPAFPFDFDAPERLIRVLSDVDVLYNTYWVRFNHRSFRHQDAVRNTLTLFEAAQRAGVRRIVHLSITNPSMDSRLEYFRGKAELEAALQASDLSYAILRPTVLFGKEDILINNIAWTLRHLPVFGVFGDGRYRLQPICVDDLARLAVEWGEREENVVVDAIGPETFMFRGLVEQIAEIIGTRVRITEISPRLAYLTGKAMGWVLRDVLVTSDEIEGLMAELLYVDSPSTGTVRLTDWAREHSQTLGRQYTSELSRRRDRRSAYRSN